MKQHFPKIFRRYTKSFLLIVVFFIGSNFLFAQSNEALHIDPSGNVGIGTTNPRGLLDVGGFINGKKIGTILGRLKEGDDEGGTYLGVRGYGTQQNDYSGQSFAIEHSFYGLVNSSINFYRGSSKQGGYLTINTSDNTQRLKISEAGVEVNGTLKANELKDVTGYVTPKGGIIMYNGKSTDFDESGKGKSGSPVEGWALCNNNNGTPDLRDRFIVGAGGKYHQNDKGGQDSVQLAMNEMPLHNHVIKVGGGDEFKADGGTTEGWPGGKIWTRTMNEGGTAKHENRPPYYALFFIMKL